MKINNGREEALFNIEKVEKKYNAQYVGEFCLKNKEGQWADEAVSIFYQKTPPKKGYSHYFALIVRNGIAYITSGQSAIEGKFYAIMADDGEIIYSRFRHDYRISKDNSVFIDGGRDYVKASSSDLIEFEINDGRYVIKSPHISLKMK